LEIFTAWKYSQYCATSWIRAVLQSSDHILSKNPSKNKPETRPIRGGLPEKMKRICRLLKLRLNPAGYVGDENVNFEPVLTNRPGIFAVGHSRRPALLTQIFDDAVNSAMQVEEILSDQLITPTQFVGSVDSEKCALCLTCVRSCPHEAVEISQEDSAAEISLRACQGCGICASECPGGAVKLEGYSDEQLLAEMGVLKKPPEVGE